MNMLNEITWKDYWTFIAIATVIYWFIIISIFYRRELLMLAKRKSSVAHLTEDNSITASNNKKLFANTSAPLFNEDEQTDDVHFYEDEQDIDEEVLIEINLTQDAHAAVYEIKEQIRIAQDRKIIKEELLFSLQQIIKAHPQVKGTSFQNDINNFIAAESENQCSIHLSAEDLNTLWVS